MAIGLYRPALSRPAAVHGQCGSRQYRLARDAVSRCAAQSRPATCTSLAVQARGIPIFINTCASDGNWAIQSLEQEILLGREEEYGIYRDDREFSRDLDRHTIPAHNKDIRRLLERASRDEPAYICLPEHASSFTQTKLVLDIYTKDEINEIFYEVCGEHGGTKKLSR
ncbi:hypothetical protein F2Q69_00045967 [Brassica cretica]|uniref:Uncharacterized protein n=1 Tax=Brassica cretica TaxID=69181 RepID=A0A8S9PW15_BRACR|nr:hypothetical protein F2Q69_00045967 [Brassica cretica]